MENEKLQNAEFLDIVFEKRNKLYGAYDLRSTYNKRMNRSVLGMILILAFIGLSSIVSSSLKSDKPEEILVDDVQLEDVKKNDEPEPPKPPPPPPPPVEPPKIDLTRFTPPVIVPDEKVDTTKQIKEVVKIEESTVGAVDQVGLKQPDVVIPPVVAAPPSEAEDEDKIFTAVEIKSSFPGGPAQWTKFLNRNLNPDVATNEGAPAGSYTVYVNFTVSRKDGGLSDIQIENDPGYGMANEAMRVMKKSPAWVPAQQNGRQVNSRFRQGITFRITEE